MTPSKRAMSGMCPWLRCADFARASSFDCGVPSPRSQSAKEARPCGGVTARKASRDHPGEGGAVEEEGGDGVLRGARVQVGHIFEIWYYYLPT